MNAAKPVTKHQIRSENTRNQLMQAAAEIFARDGFEKAQIDEIAQRSGRTRGAVYARFKTKEQLFLDLQDERMKLEGEEVTELLSKFKPEDSVGRLEAIRQHFAEVDHRRQGLLDLELKLYAVRHLESAEAWRKRYTKMFDSARFRETTGISQTKGRSLIVNRLLALAAIKSALSLAMDFLPEQFTADQYELIMFEVFDGLFPAPVPSGAKQKASAKSATKKQRSSARTSGK